MNGTTKLMVRFIALLSCSLVFVLFLFDRPVFAQTSGVSPDVVSKIIDVFYQKSSSWSAVLQGYALSIFKLCSTLTIALFGVRAVLGKENIGDVVSQFITSLLFVCLVAAVIFHYQEWSWNLINGLKGIAGELGGNEYSSEAPIKVGYDMAVAVIEKVKLFSDPVGSLGLVVCAIVIMISFALITAQIVFIKCEAMIALNASMLILGLGGATIFKEYAINVMKYVFAVAFKLFVLQLLMGLGLQFVSEITIQDAKLEDAIIMIGFSVVLLALVKNIPDVCAGIINGAHVNSGAALGQAATATAAGAAAAVGGALGAAVGSGRGVDATRKAAQLAAMEGATGLGKVGHMAGSLWQAHKQAKAEGGNLSHGERLGAAMSSRLQEMKMRNLGLGDDPGSGGSEKG